MTDEKTDKVIMNHHIYQKDTIMNTGQKKHIASFVNEQDRDECLECFEHHYNEQFFTDPSNKK